MQTGPEKLMAEVFEYETFAARVDPLVLRDDIVAEASTYFAKGEIQLGVATLAKLKRGTIDDTTLAKTDPFLTLIARDKTIIATCDHRRMPAETEVVIIY